MPAASLAVEAEPGRYDIEGFMADIGDVPVVTDAVNGAPALARLLLVQPRPQRAAQGQVGGHHRRRRATKPT